MNQERTLSKLSNYDLFPCDPTISHAQKNKEKAQHG